MSLVPPRPSPIAPGYKLDRYELICPIAEGGMASVWIARQHGKHGFQKFVAVKTILPKFASDPQFQHMFIDEARIASRIEHGNVAQILDVGEQHEVTYLVMEYVDGDALSKVNRAARRKGGAIPPGIALRVMADVCGGLHAAHELQGDDGKSLGVVHRDVSPQNVLVTTKGVAKLIDFGIAKARDRVSGDTNAETVKGKIQYMAPEQALGRAVDRRADVWAVGAVLYHLLGGKPPFEAENDIQTLFLLTSGKTPEPLRAVHPAVRAVLEKTLTHAPERRYPTAAALQQALEEAIVKAGLSTTTAAVASYLAEYVGDRAQKRRDAIAVGLKAAEEREKLADVMMANTDTTNPGKSEPGSRGSAPSVASIHTGSEAGKTLGSSAMALDPEPRKGRRAALVGAATGAVVTALVLGGVLVSRGYRARASSVAPPRATAALTPPPPLSPAPPTPEPPPPAEPAAETTPDAAPPTAATDPSATVASRPPVRAWVGGARAHADHDAHPTSPPPAAPPKTAAPPAPATKTRVNDGF